ncbi:SRPBCC family protein [Cohnella hongkongensis]|uniref:SRPBCC family protein n=1 Tax=Cohnella hongkongensis TaxID=178337 RepID=A0ABV9FGL2_9BACL
MNEYGTLYEVDGRYALKFERVFTQHPERVFRDITNPDYFSQWYPFATGEMELKRGGKIAFDDGEGSAYEGIIIKFEPPLAFAFREYDDLLNIELQLEGEGCRMLFTHTFDDRSMAVMTAAGWHRCLDALRQIVNGHPVEWKDNSAELREFYKEAFNLND